MPTKQDIIDALHRTAKENNGKPLGRDRFERETGISPYDWAKYWARFGDAQKEAGLTPNQLQAAYPDEFLIEKIVGLARKIKKFPNYSEIEVAARSGGDKEFPNKNAFYRLGAKEQFVARVLDYCKNRDGYGDIVELCEPLLGGSRRVKHVDEPGFWVGEVYLFKSGRYYKIGKTNDTVRRGNEIRVQLPEDLKMVHSIKTDDPSGIETYWLKRFESKRLNGEWFDLSPADIRAFKQWRRIA